MADQVTLASHNDAFVRDFCDDIFDFDSCSNPNPILTNVPINHEQQQQQHVPQPFSVPQTGGSGQLDEASNQILQELFWDLPEDDDTNTNNNNDNHNHNNIIMDNNNDNNNNYNNNLVNNNINHFIGYQAGTSGINGEMSNGGTENWQIPLVNMNLMDTIPITNWPPEAVAFGCTCCHVLREIIHTNGQDVTKLEVHGRLGLICHAIMELQIGASTTASRFQMIDFSKVRTEEVRMFLSGYCSERKMNGYLMVQDPLFLFYEAICVGIMDCDDNSPEDDLFNSSSPNSGKAHAEPEMVDAAPEIVNVPESSNGPDKPKSHLAAQRERTSKLTIKDISPYFHLSIEEAAKKLNVCPTVLKKVSRKGGMTRWPFRKIKSYERRISSWKANLKSGNAEQKMRAETEIRLLREEIKKICSVG